MVCGVGVGVLCMTGLRFYNSNKLRMCFCRTPGHTRICYEYRTRPPSGAEKCLCPGLETPRRPEFYLSYPLLWA